MNILSRVKKRMDKDGLPITFYLGCTVIASRFRHKKDIYGAWIAEYECDINKTEPLEYNPCFSIIVPVYNVKKDQLIACIESVQKQTYSNWQLCLVDDASTMKEVEETLKLYENDPKIAIKYRKENGHISRTTNDGLALATGEFIGLLDCDDILAPNALYEMAKKLNEDSSYDFIYSDEDMLSEDGTRRYNPVFKSEWAPDTFFSVMYTNHFSVFRREIAEKIGGYRVGYEGSQDYDFVLRFTEHTNRIGHVSKILYHWRAREESVAFDPESKMYAYQAAMRAKEDAFKRRGLHARVEYMDKIYQSRVVYEVENNPKVSIIIPSKDNPSCMKTCLSSIAEKTTYNNYEIVVIDNGSNEKNKAEYESLCEKYNANYHYLPMEFNFSKMCNIGAEHATGEFYLFLNDDTEVLVEDWLERMTGQAAQEHVGAVGAKLYYPNSKYIQHVGIVNTNEGPSHYYCKGEDIDSDYKLQMDCNYCAVTGACLMVDKNKFEEIEKFDETFPIAYNDVDLCFKLCEKGYFNVNRNDVKLYHYESISRGNDMVDKKKMKRLEMERKRLYEKHPYFLKYDPFCSQNMFLIMGIDGLGNLTPRKPQKVESVIKEKALDISLDNISFFMNISEFARLKQLKVEGWFLLKDYAHNNSNRLKVVFQSEKNSYAFKLGKMYHDPSAEIQGTKGNAKLTGYLSALDVSDVEHGEYEVYLQVKEGRFGKTYYVGTEKKIIL